MPDHDVVVIGAGVVGIAAARELASDHDVLVLDRGQVASETTAKASGLITIVADVPEMSDVARYAIDFFREYDGTGNFSFTERPSVQLVTEDDEWAHERADAVAAGGFEVRRYDADELAARYPDTFVLDDFVGGIEYPDTGWVDPYTYAMTLKDDAERRGAEFETNVAVEEVLVEDSAVRGVETDEGTVTAGTVVCAAGWRSRELLDGLVALPVRPFRWQGINLETDRGFDDEFPIAWETETNVYWRPEHNGDLHVGGGTYFVEDPGSRRDSVTEAFRRRVASTITHRVRGIEDARIAGEDCCPIGDTATPDDLPIVDAPVEGPEGLVVATGCPVGGIMSSPFVGRTVRSVVTGEEAPFDVEQFALDRFESRSTAFDCPYVTGETKPS